MNQLTAMVVKRSCLFVIQIMYPLDTFARLLQFFRDRNILVEQVHYESRCDRAATLHIYCHIEKDRIIRTVHLLERLEGVTEVERLEGK
jgi:hypothetical protein